MSIKAEGDGRRITTANYDAIVAANGSLTNLRINGVEFFQPTVSISRGSYFFQNGVVDIPSVQQGRATRSLRAIRQTEAPAREHLQ